MSLLAKPIIRNKCWLVEDNGKKFGAILNNGHSVTLVHDGRRENFASLKILSDRYNIILEKPHSKKSPQETHEVYGYPCDHKANNTLWEVQKKLPIFTKSGKSKSYFCAGYYIVEFNNGWVKSYCPKLITLNRYPFKGPFKTQEEMLEQLRIANNGTSPNTAYQEL